MNTKGRQRTSRRVPSTLVVSLVILAAGFGILSVTDPVAALHWCPSIGAAYTPAVFYQGVTTVFTVTLTNNIGDALTVTNVLVDFNWDGDTSSNGWDYDFGGTTIAPGTSENLAQSITPPSATPGTYQVELQVRGSAGSDPPGGSCPFAPANVELRSRPPLTASAAASPLSGNVPLTVSFTVTVSGGSTPYTYSWTFGDGGTSTLESPRHTYSSPGTYVAQVVVTDSLGTTAPDTVTITATIQPLSATVQANPTTGNAPLAVSFSASASGGLAPYSYQWTFGDGSSGISQSITHTYTAAGTYAAQVIVRDSLGNAVSRSIEIVVRASLSVFLIASVTSGAAPITVSFSATMSGGTPPTSYSWDFGDWNTSTEVSPTHRFDRRGVYVVHVTIRDSTGRAGTDNETIQVLAPQADLLSVGSPFLWLLVGGIGAAAIAAATRARRKRKRRRAVGYPSQWR